MFKLQRKHLLIRICRVYRGAGNGCHQVAAGIGGGGGLVSGRLQLSVVCQVFEDFRFIVLFDCNTVPIRIVCHIGEIIVVAVQCVCITGGRCPTARSVRCFCINQFEVVHTIDSGYIGRFKIPEGEDADGITIGKFCGIIVLDWRAGDGGIFFINGGVTTHRCTDGKRDAAICISDVLHTCLVRTTTSKDKEGIETNIRQECFVF